MSKSFHPSGCCSYTCHQQLPSECISLFSILSIKFLSFFLLHSSSLLLQFVVDMWVFNELFFLNLYLFLNKNWITCLSISYSLRFSFTIYNFFISNCYYRARILYYTYLLIAGCLRADCTRRNSYCFYCYFYFHSSTRCLLTSTFSLLLAIYSRFLWASSCFFLYSSSLFYLSLIYFHS